MAQGETFKMLILVNFTVHILDPSHLLIQLQLLLLPLLLLPLLFLPLLVSSLFTSGCKDDRCNYVMV